MDWVGWHEHYGRPESALARRLAAIQGQIRTFLDESPAGPLRVLSLCAGQGDDLLGVLADHPRRTDVRARLVELDAGNTAVASRRARSAGLPDVEVVTGDAGCTDRYADLAPAHLVLLCGIFGNILDDDLARTIDGCPWLCTRGGTVIWTRARGEPDRVPLICDRFERQGFERRWLSAPDAGFGVGVHRFTGTPQPLVTGTRLFRFASYEDLQRRNTR
jgi:hypothetical protein